MTENEMSLPLGLSTDEVAAEVAKGNTNRVKDKVGKSYLKIVTDNLFTVFNLIWAIIAVVLIAVGSIGNLTFLFVIIPNVLIAIIQEIRAKMTVDKLSIASEPRATVVRDGKEIEIAVEDIVLGDVMKLEMGKQVMCDAVVLSGVAEANESMLTGEADAIKKSEGDRLLSGSFLVSGAVYAKATAVGVNTYMYKIEKAAKGFKKPASNLFRDLNNLLKYIAIFMIPMAAVTAVANYFAYDGIIKTVIEKTSGSIIGMIPAGMFLLVTVTLSLSQILLGRKRTLVQDMYSIEMLACADVICLDKTGTITDGTMAVDDCVPLGDVSIGEIERIMSLLEGAEESINNTSRALIDRFGKSADEEITDKLPFSSSRKYSSVTFKTLGKYCIGAPHFVPCEVSDELDKKIEEYAALGKRVLLLSRAQSDGSETAIALIAISDRIRPNAKETIDLFQRQGVTVKVISGDHAATVSSIARRVGILNAENYISCENITDEELIAAAENHAVFGRVTPEQKVILVKALKKNGHTVAMTGDGVNDTLALKESNCAIAMAEGSEVAKSVSQIVLLESDFGTLPDVVNEGRRCINNVRQSASLFIMKTMFTICLSIFAAVTVSGYPFEPGQFSLLELFIIGAASVLLALEPNFEKIKGDFLKTILITSAPKAVAMFLPVLTLLIMFGNDGDMLMRNALCVIAVTLAGFTNLVTICIPYSKWRIGVVSFVAIGTLVTMAISIFFVNDLFKLGKAFTDPVYLTATIAAGILVPLIVYAVTVVGKRLINNRKAKKQA